MMSFNDAFDALIGIEGRYSNNPDDPGGETMYGITKRVAVENGYTGEMKDMSLEMARSIAKQSYWDRYHCDQVDIHIGYLLFDAAYNGGHPVQWLQQACGCKVDGVIGAETIAAVRNVEPWKIMMRFNAAHTRYYASLKNYAMIDGWCNRIAKNLDIGAA